MEKHNFWLLLQNYRIVFPLIQRDYAQGRTDYHSTAIRKRFVASLFRAIQGSGKGKPLMLGFIFGKNSGDRFIPFDGQQRLCTLFLLHLYAAVRSGAFQEEAVRKIFYRLRYEAREESSNFLDNILNVLSSASGAKLAALFSLTDPAPLIETYVKKQPWFSPKWHADQSICGFLVTLDEIRRSFAESENVWNILANQQNPPIQFYFADILDFDASEDDLFIKMNSRGKGLGHFDRFKAAFLEWLKWEEPEREERIARKLDNEWQDLFWKAFGKNFDGDKILQTDSAFYNFLKWFARILLHTSKAAGSEAAAGPELFRVMASALHAKQFLQAFDNNLDFLEQTLDSLALLEKHIGIKTYLNSIFLQANDAIMPQAGKISLYRNVDMFEEICQQGEIDSVGALMFFACLLQLVNNLKLLDNAKENSASSLLPGNEQIQQLRMLRNLIENSGGEIDRSAFASQLKGVAAVINKQHAEGVFNNFQLAEEKAKMLARSQNPALVEDLEWLEDHPLLRGCVAIFSQPSSRRNNLKFSGPVLRNGKKLFELVLGDKPLHWDQVLRGFLSQNIFGLREGSLSNKYFYLGKNDHEGRRRIFTTCRADCFSEIRDAVQKLAEKISPSTNFSMESVVGKIVYKWVEKCREERRMDWRWYFVAYPEILPSFCQTDGYYDWNYSWRSFEQRALQKQIMKGPHKNPYLWAVYVESGFYDPDRNKGRAKFKELSGKGKDNPIAFPRSKLGLWGGELFWRIYTMHGKQATKKQLALLADLRQRLARRGIDINPDGYCFIPGKDSRKWDQASFSPEESADVIRQYDTVDRVELGKQIALEMANLV